MSLLVHTETHKGPSRSVLTHTSKSSLETDDRSFINKNSPFERAEDYISHKRFGKLRDLNKEVLRDMKNKPWKPQLEVIPEGKEPAFERQIAVLDAIAYGGGITKLAKLANVDIPSWMINEVEDLMLLFVSLSGQTTYPGAIASIISWVKRYFNKSITLSIEEYLTELLKPKETRQSDSGIPEIPEWLRALKTCKTDWSLIRHNQAFGQLSKLLGLLVTLGLCKASNLEFRLNGYLMFTPELQKKHSSAFDLIDATFETILFFVEGMYLCFATRSVRPLLVSDHAALQLDVEYANVMAEWDLVRNGNLFKFKGKSDHEFTTRLNNLSTDLKNLGSVLTGFDRKLVMDKFQKILILQNDFVSMKLCSGIRHSPYAMLLFGESSQGKTMAGDQILDALCASQGLQAGKEFRATFNAGDKYMSNWTSDKVVLKFDDLCNDKSGFVERPPTRAILDVINNEMYYAPKAELEGKGKCFVAPWLVLGTTNKKDMDAALYSNCPYSIQRRFIVITVTAKRQFQRVVDGVTCGVDTEKVRAFNKAQPTTPLFDDIWEFTVEKAVKPEKMSTVARYKTLFHKGKKLAKISIYQLISFLCDDFDTHRNGQESLLAGMRARDNTLKRCWFIDPLGNRCPQLEGHCSKHDRMERQFGGKIRDAAYALIPKARQRVDTDILERLEDKAAQVLYEKGSRFFKEFDWVEFIPQSVVDYIIRDADDFPFEDSWRRSIFQLLYKDVLEQDFERNAKSCTWFCGMMAVFSFLFAWFTFGNPFYGLPFVTMAAIFYLSYMVKLQDALEKELLVKLYNKNLNVSPIVKSVRDDRVKYAIGGCAALGCLYFVGKAVRDHYAKMKTQGSLSPVTQAEVDERDAEKNVWTQVTSRPLPISDISKTVTPSVLQGLVDKNQVCCQMERPDGSIGQMNCLVLRPNAVLIPGHYFDDVGPSMACSFYKSNSSSNGGKFCSRIELETSYRVPGTDLAICYITSGGSFRDLTKHFPLEDISGNVNFHLNYRFRSGVLKTSKGSGEVADVDVDDTYSYTGLRYLLDSNTFPGMCGATLHSESSGSVILGIHLAGVEGTGYGVAGIISQKQLMDGYRAIRLEPGVLLTGSGEKFEKQVLGVNVIDPNAVPHPKSPLRYMPHETQVEYYGSCPGMVSSHTDVKVTPISAHVMDVCDVPNIYGPPEFKPEWKGYQDCLANLSIPAIPYEYSFLKKAVLDYESDLLEIFKRDLWKNTRPLTDMENCSGIPGLRFIDAIKLNTSIGYPLSGPKSKYVFIAKTVDDLMAYYEEMNLPPDPEEIMRLASGHTFQVVKFIDEISVEIERVEDCYRRGERAYPIAKACKKDEILSKKKCRIFYANSIALTYLIRKYYLPLLRVLQMNPLVSECAVGINSHGPEWEQFHQHVFQFGEDRLMGGDYGNYDQKLCSQLIIAALRILIDCAELCEYTEEDLRVMEALVGDIVYSIIAFNGDLIGLTEGTHISGNSLTVIINGICGSLNLRCYFYSNPDHAHLKFRDNVALMTYGDDNIGSVSPDLDGFTIKGASEFLAKYGQKYTMPDKESELLDFLPVEEFEFLKRKSVYHPELGCHVGALVDKSCFKMLHCFMRSKGSPDTEDIAAAKNIDTALSEWFNHGEDVFEKRRAQMIEVAKRAGINGFCAGLDKDYLSRVEDWKETYAKTW